MMRHVTRIVAAVTLAVAALAGPASANQCPLLIKQVKDAIAKLPAGDAKARQAQTLVDEAQKLHESASHAKSIEKADEAAKVLGITLTKR